MLRVCVFGSSSPKTPQLYKDEAFRLGQLLAERGHVCVNGGGGQGVMGSTNDGCRAAGGAIMGIIHEMFCVDNDEDRKIPNMIKAAGPDLNERKQLLMDHSDCFIVMPGGTGTFDEVWDVVSHRSLGMKGLQGKPLVLVNMRGRSVSPADLPSSTCLLSSPSHPLPTHIPRLPLLLPLPLPPEQVSTTASSCSCSGPRRRASSTAR